VSLDTGARIGELIALEWRDVNLTDGKIRIRHTYDAVDGLTAPKDRDARDVYLTPGAQEAFGDWIEEVGVKQSGRVFTAPRSGEYVNADYLRKIVLAAMRDEAVEIIDAQSGPAPQAAALVARDVRAAHARAGEAPAVGRGAAGAC
jgi:integrase